MSNRTRYFNVIREHVEKKFPGLSDTRKQLIADAVLDQSTVAPLIESDDFDFIFRDEADKYLAANPVFSVQTPRPYDLLEFLDAQYRADNAGLAMPGDRKLALAREFRDMNETSLLAKAQELGFKPIENSPATASSSTPGCKRFGEMTIEELDAEVERRMGISVKDIPISKRRAYHDALRALDPPVQNTMMRENSIRSALTPEQRIAEFREKNQK
ncbi:MAG: hypothetical protein R3D68_07085 [Hyphomicrobiaceae bacterium]